MPYPQPGDTVFIKGTVIRTHNLQADEDPARQSVEAQTADGQHLWTNLANVVTAPNVVTAEVKPKPKSK